MIETTVGHIRSQVFGTAWGKTLSCPAFPSETKYKLIKMEKALKAELDPALQTLEEVAKKFGELEPLTGQYKIKDEHKEEWAKELAKVHDIKISVDRPKIAMQDLDKASLSPMDLIALEFMLHELEVVTGGENEGQKTDKEKTV